MTLDQVKAAAIKEGLTHVASIFDWTPIEEWNPCPKEKDRSYKLQGHNIISESLTYAGVSSCWTLTRLGVKG